MCVYMIKLCRYPLHISRIHIWGREYTHTHPIGSVSLKLRHVLKLWKVLPFKTLSELSLCNHKTFFISPLLISQNIAWKMLFSRLYLRQRLSCTLRQQYRTLSPPDSETNSIRTRTKDSTSPFLCTWRRQRKIALCYASTMSWDVHCGAGLTCNDVWWKYVPAK